MPPSPPPSDDPDDLLAVLEGLRPEGAAWPPPSWLRLVFRGEDPPVELILASVRAAPGEAVPWLAAIVDDDDLSFEEAVGDGCAPITAAAVLGSLPTPEAIAALIRAVERTDDEYLHEAAVASLSLIGEPAMEPLIAARAVCPEGSVERGSLTAAIALLPGPHPRIREVLLEALDEDEEHGAPLCGLSEDPALVAPLRVRWDAYEVAEGRGSVDANAAGAQLGQALVRLGAPWSEVDAAKLARCFDALGWNDGDGGPAHDRHHRHLGDRGNEDEADEEDRVFLREDLREILDDAERLKRPNGAPVADVARDDRVPVDPLVRREAPGRNDPCWCGSGKKYKKCHLDADGA